MASVGEQNWWCWCSSVLLEKKEKSTSSSVKNHKKSSDGALESALETQYGNFFARSHENNAWKFLKIAYHTYKTVTNAKTEKFYLESELKKKTRRHLGSFSQLLASLGVCLFRFWFEFFDRKTNFYFLLRNILKEHLFLMFWYLV